ncbi:alpha/beta hydrolase family protein [Fodinibius roseus]|nr:prolyl oligopeptidase family serine peptidase [Fodinibius roseus]
MEDDILSGINNYLTRYTEKIIERRHEYWDRNTRSIEAYRESVAPNRNKLKEILGVVDPRAPVRMVSEGMETKAPVVGESANSTIYSVRWTVMDGLTSEGLLLVPKGNITASAVVIPDAEEDPEMYAGLKEGPGTALSLAESGVQVLIPQLVDRRSDYSGSKKLVPRKPWTGNAEPVAVSTNQSHREWIYRQGYIMGRHIIGLEIQKVLTAVDWLEENAHDSSLPVGVMGYGEGGLLAFYSSAIDERIEASWISGYFGPRDELWKEPIDRNIWGLLTEFGDAEIASLIAPRKMIIEHVPVPDVEEPLPVKGDQLDYGLPGKLTTPDRKQVEEELDRLYDFFPDAGHVQPDVEFISSTSHGSTKALASFGRALGSKTVPDSDASLQRSVCADASSFIENRAHRVFNNMQEYIQDMIPASDQRRYEFLQGDISSADSWDKDMEPYRREFYEEVMGKIPEPLLAMNPRMRQVYNEPGWDGYEVVLDVWPGVVSWGILAVPKDLSDDEKRPAVVMQHGASGLPSTPIIVDSYFQVLPALVNRGFVVFAPYNPYQFNIRKANAVKAGTFSVIIPQHKQILNFLQSLDYVDGERIALYGKSWGGRTAQTVPIVLDRYKVAISSAYFNDWVRKIASVDYRNSYYFTKSTGVYHWNMGNTFTHAEMASLIAPRPFMVESGYLDGVAAHEMVAYEFAKVKRLYSHLGIGDRAELEFFMGGHDINGQGTFRFLHKHLEWPAPDNPTEHQMISPP